MYAPPIRKLIDAFKRLPSVGERSAERFVFFLLGSGKKTVAELSLALRDIMEQVKSCEVCWDFSDRSPCPICSDTKRDHSIICVVEAPQDLQTIENTDHFDGLYHVLRGTIRPDDEESAARLKVPELLARVKKPEIKEVILALSPDLEGETTMMYLEKKLDEARDDLTITRLARGLPMGSDIQYADEVTLGNALKFRQ